jgi:hypothetical protein
MGVLQLLDADETTLLCDFHDPTGAAKNPGTVLTKLGAASVEDLGRRSVRRGRRRQRVGDEHPPSRTACNRLGASNQQGGP